MEVRNCKNCGRLFNYAGGAPICSSCKKELEDKFQEVKKYIQDNKAATIDMVAEETDTPVKQIKQWIKEERLVLSNPSASGVTCEICGEPITTGRYCEACKAKTQGDIASAIDKKEPARPKKKERENPRMRFLDK